MINMQTLKKEVAKYLYSFFGNACYHNEDYFASLVKKYGKKAVHDMMKYVKENGGMSNALRK